MLNHLNLKASFGIGLIKAVDKIEWKTILDSKDPEKTIKSYLAKRVRGAIRRATDTNRSGMRIPEHKLNDIRKNFEDESNSSLFFNSMFESIDKQLDDENSYLYQIEDKSKDPMRKEKLHAVIRNVMLKNLSDKEYHVIRLSYGLDCNKRSAKQIADYLNMGGVSSYVRVSQLKKQAIEKLKKVLKHSQVTDYL
jgi:RNA polymerase sigma factor (sigma-70 family)